MTDSDPDLVQEAHASVIKDVHAQLRAKCQNSAAERPEDVWIEHVNNTHVLKKYADSMHKLATEVWQVKHQETPENSRIKWIHDAILDYYTIPQLERARGYDQRLAERHGMESEVWRSGAELSELEEYDTLDVGSCYGPLAGADRLKVTSFDLQPADESVFKGDLLQLPITSTTTFSNNQLLSLAANSYHAVVFSLVLEYLPTAALRYEMCQKAAELLMPEGILVIASPDSSHRTANGRLYRGWKIALETIGLIRVRYEKLEHLHCMVFRKSVHPELARRDAHGHRWDAAVRNRLVWTGTATWCPSSEPEVPEFPTRGQESATVLTVSDSSAADKECPPLNVEEDCACDHDDFKVESHEPTSCSDDEVTSRVSGTPVPAAWQLMVIHQDFKRVVLRTEVTSGSEVSDREVDFSDALEALPLL